jgi:hypothetical protein
MKTMKYKASETIKVATRAEVDDTVSVTMRAATVANLTCEAVGVVAVMCVSRSWRCSRSDPCTVTR